MFIMTIYVLISLVLNILIGCYIFKILYRSRKLFSDRYAMIISTVFSIMISFTIGFQLYLLIPISLAVITLFAMLIGGGAGSFIGSMVKFQSLLGGFFHGTTGGLMGVMLGAIILNPELCNLPSSSELLVIQTKLLLNSFVNVLSLLTFGLIYFSLRV